jgi:hypothetical protein
MKCKVKNSTPPPQSFSLPSSSTPPSTVKTSLGTVLWVPLLTTLQCNRVICPTIPLRTSQICITIATPTRCLTRLTSRNSLLKLPTKTWMALSLNSPRPSTIRRPITIFRATLSNLETSLLANIPAWIMLLPVFMKLLSSRESYIPQLTIISFPSVRESPYSEMTWAGTISTSQKMKRTAQCATTLICWRDLSYHSLT